MSKLQGGHVPQCPIAGDANVKIASRIVSYRIVLVSRERRESLTEEELDLKNAIHTIQIDATKLSGHIGW